MDRRPADADAGGDDETTPTKGTATPATMPAAPVNTNPFLSPLSGTMATAAPPGPVSHPVADHPTDDATSVRPSPGASSETRTTATASATDG